MWRHAAIVLTAAVAGGCGAATLSGHHAPPAVPWVDRPAPRYEPPPDRAIRYPTDAPPCKARFLRARSGRGGGGLGHLLYRFTFTNTGRQPCLATRFPKVDLRTARGRRVSVQRAREGTYFGKLVPADIAPGHAAELDIAGKM